jgi:AcrR family transcriptional regulator
LLSHRARPRRHAVGRPCFSRSVTHEALLDAAEELFATLGVEGVSIRTINAVAGFGPATVHRHFTSKDRLVEAVIRRRAETIAGRHVELLAALTEGGRSPTVLEFVGAHATPYCELVERYGLRGLQFLQLLARLTLTSDPLLTKVSDELGTAHYFTGALRRIFPGVPLPRLYKGATVALDTLVHHLANPAIWRVNGAAGKRTRRSNTEVDILIRFVASGLAEIMIMPKKRRRHSALR